MTLSLWRAACRLRIVITVALAVVASSLAPAAGTAFAQSTLYPGAVGLVANTGGDPVLLRETPSFDAAVLSSLSNGTPADILEGPVYSADGVAWHGVSVGGVTGYIVAGYLTDSGQAAAPVEMAQEAAPVELAQEAVPVEMAQEAAPVTTAPEMASAEPMAAEAAPAETLPAPVVSPGQVPANPITTADLNLRAGPSFGDAVLLVIPAGAALAPTGEWSQGYVGVTYQGNYGWVDGAWLAAGEASPELAETPKEVALMQEAAPVPVPVAEAAPTKDASLDTALAVDPSAATEQPAYATDIASLRAAPSESAEVLRVLPEGGPVTITGASSAGWTPVWYNGTAGYISANLLSTSTSPVTTTAPVSLAQEAAPVAEPLVAADPVTESGAGELAATTLRNVNLRGGPAMTAPLMGTIPPGTTLTALTGPEQGFYQVQYGEQVGWVAAEYLQVSASYLQRRDRNDDDRNDGNRNDREGKVDGSAPADNVTLGAGGIIWPVSGGQWTIMQGYNGSSHQNQSSLWQYQYSLDLARVDGNTAGQPVISPVNGVVTWTDPGTGGISIDIGNGYAVALFHATYVNGLGAGSTVSQGQYIGEVSGPGGNGFAGGEGHIQITLWASNDNGNWDRRARPFTGQYAISGMDFPDTGGGNAHRGVQFSP